MLEDDFVKGVEDGLRLSKRIYFGKDRAVAPPKLPEMEKSGQAYLPKAPMVYAVIVDPKIVDNPDIPSYQPYVHGRCDPPALIPLQMNGIAVEVNCYLDTAFVKVRGNWRVHCVMGSRSCDCRIAIPMGEQGSILGVDVEVSKRLHSTELIATDDQKGTQTTTWPEDGGFLKSNIFILSIPKIDGGSNISIKVDWSQKIFYWDDQFNLSVPFSFPEFVTPTVKKISKSEKIELNVNCGAGMEVTCMTTSHSLKKRCQAGSFLYEAEVFTWSNTDLSFSYSVSSSHISGNVLLQYPSMHDIDQREIFCLYLFPDIQQSRKVFRREIVFLVDISGSMGGKPLEDTKNVLSVALSELDAQDSFNIIAFNQETCLFSSSMELVTKEAILNATKWMDTHLIGEGGTNILLPLNQAVEFLSNARGSRPIIFLITDGAVEDERYICDVMKSHLKEREYMHPRIFTFGIGTFCNHHFLRMLATIGRGHHEAAYDIGSIGHHLQRFFKCALTAVLANITIDRTNDLQLEVFPNRVPDLLSDCPLILSGRYEGKFPSSLRLRGILADLEDFVVELKVQQAKEIPLDRVFAKQQIDLLTAQAWYSENKQLREKVTGMSLRTGVGSEYSHMILVSSEEGKKEIDRPVSEYTCMIGTEPHGGKKEKDSAGNSNTEMGPKPQKITLLGSLGVGFGSISATCENTPPGCREERPPDAGEVWAKAAAGCCGRMCECCCGMYCLRGCSRLNDQCAILLTQVCTSMACLGCLACCKEICCPGNDG